MSYSLLEEIEARDAEICETFDAHVKRVQESLNLPNQYGNPAIRQHLNDDGDEIFGWTMIYWADDINPILIGSIIREKTGILLSIIDRSGDSPTVIEHRF